MHIKLNNIESVLAKCASPIKINEEAKNRVINKLCSNEKINLVIKVKNIIVIKVLKRRNPIRTYFFHAKSFSCK